MMAENASSEQQSVPARLAIVGKDFDVSPYTAAFTTFALVVGSWLLYCKILSGYSSVSGEYLSSLPWAGSKKRWLSTLRTKVKSITGLRSLLQDGYQTYSKYDKAYVMPQFADDSYVILPTSTLRDLLDKTDAEVDGHIIHNEHVESSYTLGDDISTDAFQLDVVRRQLTRKLHLFVGTVYSELALGFEDVWKPNHDEWKAIKVFPTCMKIVARAANRVFTGDSLCQNMDFIEHTRLYTEAAFGAAKVIKLFPMWLRPIVAPMITFPNRRNLAVCKKYTIPIIQERLDMIAKKSSQPDLGWQLPEDAISWVIDESQKRNVLDPEQICRRLLVINMVAVHTTTITISHTILDIFSSPHVEKIVESLREECTRVFKAYGGTWTKEAVNDLYRIDSAIRESMRYSGIGALGIQRMVTSPSGISLSSNIHVPPNVRVAISAHSIHHDPSFHSSPLEYDAFRFSRPREQGNATKIGNLSLTTPNEGFLAFGVGRHACPGRFFAAQELKLMLAHLVMNYDVKIEGGRPANVQVGQATLPSPGAEISVRKRKGGESDS